MPFDTGCSGVRVKPLGTAANLKSSVLSSSTSGGWGPFCVAGVAPDTGTPRESGSPLGHRSGSPLDCRSGLPLDCETGRLCEASLGGALLKGERGAALGGILSGEGERLGLLSTEAGVWGGLNRGWLGRAPRGLARACGASCKGWT